MLHDEPGIVYNTFLKDCQIYTCYAKPEKNQNYINYFRFTSQKVPYSDPLAYTLIVIPVTIYLHILNFMVSVFKYLQALNCHCEEGRDLQ